MSFLGQDLRFAIRSLARRPGFVVAVVFALALGMGANTAVFSLVDAVLLHPLPVARPDEVVAIYEAVTDRALNNALSYPHFNAIASDNRSFTSVAGFTSAETAVRTSRGIDQLTVAPVSGSYFALLGLRPQVGRLLLPSDDDVPGTHPVVVISDAFWERAFSRDRSAVGSTIHLGGNPFTVVGVAPRGFRGTRLSSLPQLWVPFTMLADIGAGRFFAPGNRERIFTSPTMSIVDAIGRLRPGVTPAAAASELNVIREQERRRHPTPPAAQRGYSGAEVKTPMHVQSLSASATLGERETLVRFVAMLLAVVGLTLVIACVNVANLMLVRAAERMTELTLRAALGASRGRIVTQLLVDSLLLSIAGAIGGIAFGAVTIRLLSRFTLPGNISLADAGLSLDARVLAFAGLLSVLTAILFGLVPALRASRPDLAAMLRARTSAGQRGSRELLLGSQVAISLALLVGAGLFVRSLRAGLATDIGFDPRPLAALSVSPDLRGYSDADNRTYQAEIVARARALPGVTGAALTSHVPLEDLHGRYPFLQSPAIPKAVPVDLAWVPISPGFFDVLRVPLIEGRAFTDADGSGAPPVAIMNQSAARALFPDGHAVGRKIDHAGMLSYTVVGVVNDTKYESVRDANTAVLFVSMAQAGLARPTVLVRSDNPEAALGALRKLLSDLPPQPPVREARLVGGQVEAALMPQRFGATLLGVFALVALVISAIGTYSVVSYAVSQRTAELGIRMALGAQGGDVVRLLLGRSSVVVGLGVLAGVLGAVAGARGLGRFLYGTSPLDVTAFGGATLVVAAAAMVAALVPARRAARIDPLTTIRGQ